MGINCGSYRGNFQPRHMVLQGQYGNTLQSPVSYEAFFLLLDSWLCYRNFEIHSLRSFVISPNAEFSYAHLNFWDESCIHSDSWRATELPSSRRNSSLQKAEISWESAQGFVYVYNVCWSSFISRPSSGRFTVYQQKCPFVSIASASSPSGKLCWQKDIFWQ